jgi:hypothetical protein
MIKLLLLNPPRHLRHVGGPYYFGFNLNRYRRGVDINYGVSFPCELAFLGSYLRLRGIAVEILDANALQLCSRDVINHIILNGFTHVVIRGGDMTILDDAMYVHTIEGLGKKVLLWENILNPVYYHRTCKELGIHNVLAGEVETGVEYFLSGGSGCINETNPASIDSLGVPAFDLLPVKKYSYEGRRTWYTFLSRGCSWSKCSFCMRSKTAQVFQIRSAGLFDEECRCALKHGFTNVFLYDDEINTSIDQALKTSDVLRSNRLTWECWMRADNFNEELIKTMARSGCYRISVGVESGSQKILDTLSKGTTIENIRHLFVLCQKYHIQTVASLIIGTPWETENSMAETELFIKKLKPSILYVANYRPFPGSQLFDYVAKNNLLVKDLYTQALEGNCSGGTVYAKTLYLDEKRIQFWNKRLNTIGHSVALQTYLKSPQSWIRILGNYVEMKIREKTFASTTHL